MLHIGHQREDSPEELDIELEGKKLTHGDSFVYIGRALCGDGNTEKDVGLRRRARPTSESTGQCEHEESS